MKTTVSSKLSYLLIVVLCGLLATGCTVSLQEEVPSGKAAQDTTTVDAGVIQPDVNQQVEQAPDLSQQEAVPVPNPEPAPETEAPQQATEQQPAPETEAPIQDLVTEEQAQPAETNEQPAAESPQPPAEPTVDLNAGTNQGQSTIHQVRPRDTVGTIAQGYGITIDDVLAANPDIGNGYYIYVGQELVIPPAGTAASQAAQQPAAPANNQGGGTYQSYYVRAGDTLGIIAQSFGYSIEELANYNGIVNINAIKVGQEIRIPSR